MAARRICFDRLSGTMARSSPSMLLSLVITSHSTEGSRDPSSSEAWIAIWCAGRRNDFEMTAAPRRNLHLPINCGWRAYDALRPSEFVA
jgi:hypothetical protein